MIGPASVGDALRAAAQRLRVSGSRSPRLDAELLLAAALGVTRAELFRGPERRLDTDEAGRFEVLLRRREAREPVAYIRGLRAFRTIELEVTPDVLIPRPETETLVEVALEALAGAPAGPPTGAAGPAPADAGPPAGGPSSVTEGIAGQPDDEARQAAVPAEPYEPVALDVGTGSGCIALALAAENPFVRVVAADVSGAALAVARRNAARLGLERRVDFVRSDLFEGLPARPSFDLIVSNPPYVPTAEHAALEPNVRDYEPALALVAGEDGLDVYRRLVPTAATRLRPGGALALEVGAGQAAAVRELLAAAGAYGPSEARADLAGVPRVVWARLRSPSEAG